MVLYLLSVSITIDVIVLLVAFDLSNARKNAVFFSPSSINFIRDLVCAPRAFANSLISNSAFSFLIFFIFFFSRPSLSFCFASCFSNSFSLVAISVSLFFVVFCFCCFIVD